MELYKSVANPKAVFSNIMTIRLGVSGEEAGDMFDILVEKAIEDKLMGNLLAAKTNSELCLTDLKLKQYSERAFSTCKNTFIVDKGKAYFIGIFWIAVGAITGCKGIVDEGCRWAKFGNKPSLLRDGKDISKESRKRPSKFISGGSRG